MENFFEAGMHWRILNFLIFLGVLVYFLRKPVSRVWSDRAEALRREISETKRLREESSRKHDSLSRRLTLLEKEAAEMIRSLQEEGERERQFILIETEKLAERMKRDFEGMADQEVRKVRQTLKAQAVQLSIDYAERIIREGMKIEDQKRMMGGYLASLEKEVR